MMETQIFAHRGARRKAPENTIPAYLKALETEEIDGLEIDVHLTKDNQLVVIHDEKLERTTNGHGLVGDYTLAELQALDAGSYFSPEFAGTKIPSLDEVLTFLQVQHFHKILLIEVKTDHVEYPGIEQRLLDKIAEYHVTYPVIYQSFNLDTLQRLHDLDDTLAIDALTYTPRWRLWKLQRQRVIEYIHPDNRWFMNKIYWWGKHPRTRPWTVNKKAEMRKVFQAKLPGIITDELDLAVQLRKEIQG
ncbi:glycerophosphodiester phosphodiesterase [Periweissella cryptocerci]|uniref:Glycerophosphodiester phosphodiesterase n=1 Tax=Periweissella cryptocerci TaxID=2506420 RepID=A0A4P6YVW7_9LACO|nr:glycerophosphodiester phosphodiesterase family protein [Periweissella cryptocerci]QBO36903.1 glycerophosphodiester phosphodiesterase [Periweissella cryptocerci]